jgi:hypothetical protein
LRLLLHSSKRPLTSSRVIIAVSLRAMPFLLAGSPAAERRYQLSTDQFMQACRKLTIHFSPRRRR